MKRDAIFISHANPEDNIFTKWLGAKLTSAGYEVWADVLRLRGGHDWQRKLESALRDRACKVLVVATPTSVDKQGVRNEIQIATDTGKEIGDSEFIIPLRLERFRAPFLVAHAQYIDFFHGWAKGLLELLDTLKEYKVPLEADETPSIWRDVHLIHARTVAPVEERLISNWLRFENLPQQLSFYDFRAGISIGRAKTTLNETPLPVVPFKRGFLSFAAFPSAQEAMGSELPIETVGSEPTSTFVDEGWSKQSIGGSDARNMTNRLLGNAIEKLFQKKGLSYAELANDRRAWYLPNTIAPDGQVRFSWQGGVAGRRQIVGFSPKRDLWWHYGVSPQVVMWPEPHVKWRSRLVFTGDGVQPIASAARMHRLRRSFAKAWRNARWRDMMLAFLWWLSEGEEQIVVPFGDEEKAVLAALPIILPSPVSMRDESAFPDDQDDPDDFDPEGDEREAPDDDVAADEDNEP